MVNGLSRIAKCWTDGEAVHFWKCEALERRVLLSLTTNGQPSWSEQGPGPISYSGTTYTSDGDVAAVAPDPSNANRLFVAGINGGIWVTNNATSANPSWTPLTDSQPSLATTALALDLSDSSHNTLLAGYGNLSSFFNRGGDVSGLIRSTNAGASWTTLDTADFYGRSIRRIVPTSLMDPGQLILVATVTSQSSGAGVYRSIDGGATFSVALSGASDIRPDPSTSNLFYAGDPGLGVYRSSGNFGSSWSSISSNIPSSVTSGTTRVEISVSPAADPGTGQHPVYAVFISGTTVTGIYRTADPGDYTPSWTSLGIPALGYDGEHLSVLADKISATGVFVTSVAGPFYWNGSSWLNLTGSAVNNTSRHSDSRDAEYDANGNMIESDDGGVYRLTNPDGTGSATRQFTPLNGSANNSPLRVTELFSIAYDSLNHVYFGGSWDNGDVLQASQDSTLTSEIYGGDGGVVAVDNSQAGKSIHFDSVYNGGTSIGKITYNSNNQITANTEVPLIVNGTGGQSLYDYDPDFTNDYYHFKHFILNSVNQQQMFLETANGLYESFDQGNTVNLLGSIGSASAYAYGGGGNAGVIYYATGNELYVRSGSTGLPTLATYPGSALSGSYISDIEVDPNNWQNVYVADSGLGKIYMSTNAGATLSGWVDLTGTTAYGLTALTSGPNSLAIIPSSASSGTESLVAATNTGVYVTRNPTAGAATVWTRVGDNFPTASVTAVTYNATDDVLLAAVVGRGAWKLKNASAVLLGGKSGLPDPTFSGTGKLLLSSPNSNELNQFPTAIALQPNGQQVIAGTYVTSSGGTDFFVTRINQDGSVDASFATSGVAKFAITSGNNGARGLTILPSGEILVVGYDYTAGKGDNVAVALLSNAGVVERTASYSFGSGVHDDYAQAVAFDGENAIIACVANSSGSTSSFGLLRINPSTTNLGLDTSFGAGGEVSFNISRPDEAATCIALQNDGKIVVGGWSQGGSGGGNLNWAFARLDNNGTFDSTFGFGGTRIIDFSGGDDVCNAVVIQPDGKIVLGGWGTSSGNRNFLVARYNSNGFEDYPFGGGAAAYSFDFGGGSDDEATSMALQPDGKIILGGVTNNHGYYNAIAFVRFTAAGFPDTSFGQYGTGQADSYYPNYSAAFGTAAITLDADGRVLASTNVFSSTNTAVTGFEVTRITPGEYAFKGTPITVPAIIDAENYDNGGPSVAYSDTTVDANEAAAEGLAYNSNYRPGSGVDLEQDTEGGNDVHAAFVHASEYLNYTINALYSGYYGLEERVASNGIGGTFNVLVDGNIQLRNVTVPNTGGFLTFTTISQDGLYLSSGVHVLQLAMITNGASGFVANLNWIGVQGHLTLKGTDLSVYEVNSVVSVVVDNATTNYASSILTGVDITETGSSGAIFVTTNLGVPITAAGGAGNDTFNIFEGYGTAPAPANITIDGGGGANSIQFYAGAATGALAVTPNTITFGSDLINYSNTTAPVIDPGGGTDALTIIGTTPSLGNLQFTLNPAKNFSSINFVSGGRLDANNLEMIVQESSATIRSILASKQLFTSVTPGELGYLDLGGGQTEIKYTLPGDANLDGTVNFADLLAVAQNYGKSGQFWAGGDFNYDGSVNFSDLLAVAQNYNKTLPALEAVRARA